LEGKKMRKLLLIIAIILIPSFCLASQGMGPGPGIGSAIIYAKFLITSDDKILITSDGKILKTSGTELSNKWLVTSDDKVLITSDNKLLTTP
jgi:hypothetical protein